MKQLLCTDYGKVELIEVPKPKIDKDEMLVKMHLCGVCGSDLSKIFSKNTPKPIQLGHEIVGTVVEVGENAAQFFSVGQRVVALHHIPNFGSHCTLRGSETMDEQFKMTDFYPGGFAEYVKLSALHVQYATKVIPDTMSDDKAVFTEPLTCVARSLSRINIIHGDKVAIMGIGAVGQLFLPLLQDLHTQVLSCDISKEKLEFSEQWGAKDTLLIDTTKETHVPDSLQKSYDFIILTVVNETSLSIALQLVRDGGTMMVFGVKPGTFINTDMFQIWRREINIISSYGSSPRYIPEALAMLEHDRYNIERTISHKIPLLSSEVVNFVNLLVEGKASKVVITNY